jgi:hypothetical protein
MLPEAIAQYANVYFRTNMHSTLSYVCDFDIESVEERHWLTRRVLPDDEPVSITTGVAGFDTGFHSDEHGGWFGKM